MSSPPVMSSPISKTCKACKTEKLLTEFVKSKKSPHGRGANCYVCHRVYTSRWYRAHRNEHIARTSENTRRRKSKISYAPHNVRRYGITPEQYAKLFEEQDGKCRICHKPETGANKWLSTDHDHATGMVRGLLCNQCNLGLGNFRDSQDLLARAIEYLR
jgi:hypothetical protein